MQGFGFCIYGLKCKGHGNRGQEEKRYAPTMIFYDVIYQALLLLAVC